MQSITNSLLGSAAAVSFSYAELGRMTNRSVGINNPVTTGYDAMSRVTSVTNPLGTHLAVDEHDQHNDGRRDDDEDQDGRSKVVHGIVLKFVARPTVTFAASER